MTALAWPDVEALVIGRVLPVLVGGLDPLGEHQLDAAPATPPDLEGRWFVRIQVINGVDDGLTDAAVVDVESFAPTRAEAHDLAAQARMAILALAGTTGPGGLVDTVDTVARPRWIDYRNPAVNRVAATYRVTTRLQ